MRNIITIALILILPLVAYLFMDSHKKHSMISEAQAGNKPMVMIFSSSMCAECVKMKKIIAEVEPIYELTVAFVRIDAQSSDKEVQSLVKKHKITLVPTMVFINSAGKTVHKQEGYMDKVSFEKRIGELLNE